MLMSTALELKFHFWPKTQHEDITYKPPVSTRVTCASWSKDNSYLTYLSEKSKPEIICLKDPHNIKLVHTVAAVNDVSAVIFQRTTKRCIGVGTQNGQVAMYDTKTKTINKLFENVPSSVRYMDFNSGDQHLAVACVSGNAVLYDVSNGHFCGNYVVSETDEPTALRFHPNLPNILAAAGADGTVMLWDTVTANKTFLSKTHTSAISGIAFGQQDHDILVSAGVDNKFCVHDLNARECVFRSSTQHPLSAVDVSSDGSTIAIGSQEGIIYIYDMRNFLQPITSWKAHNTKINKLLFQYPVKDQMHDASVSDFIAKTVSDAQHARKRIGEPDLKPGASVASSKLSVASKKSFEKPIEQVDNEFLKKVQTEIVTHIKKDAHDLSAHLRGHMYNLEGFIQSEFQKMDQQMEEKWELLNFATVTLNKDNDDVSVIGSIGRSSNDRLILK